MARGDWKPPAQKQRTARLKRASQVLKGDEVRFSTKGKVTLVTDVRADDEGRRVFQTSTMGERVLHPEASLLVLDPKPPSKADQRRPR